MTGWDYRNLEDAAGAVLSNSRPLRATETVKLDDATGRVLASAVKSRVAVPPWDRSAVDGFAIRSCDALGGETTLRIVGETKAGAFFRGKVGKGECVRIATGAPMPAGSDCSVMFERVKESGGCISFSFRAEKHGEVMVRGVDIRKGSTVAAGGTVITTGVVGALASQGTTQVRVFRKPSVAIFPGGDEVAPIGSRAGKWQIYDVNSHTIASLVRKAGGDPVIMETVADTRRAVRSALLRGCRHDACVFASGSSVGKRDFVAGTIEEEGRLLFHGIRIRPGRPTMFGVVGGKPVFGLAGHPVSSFLGAYFLLAPAVRKLSGLGQRPPVLVEAIFEGEARPDEKMRHLIPVAVRDGRCRSVLKESGAITSISMANGIVIQEVGQHIKDGDTVKAELID